MPGKEIKELRHAGKLEEALEMAKAELESMPDNIWAKRNISWVFFEYLKLNSSSENFDSFIEWLNQINNLELTADEKMLFEQLCWQIGKLAFSLSNANPIDTNKGIILFEAIRTIPFPEKSNAYSFLFKALHKLFKETDKYLQIADWWNFENFLPEDFQKDVLTDNTEVMAIAEQAYITYAKHLLPNQTQFGITAFDRVKAESFLPKLSHIADTYPQFQYPGYFKAKLLLAMGDRDNMLSSLLPFARKKQNDFWVWEILAEAYSEDPETVFACYCKALTCRSPETMLVRLRQKMAKQFIAKELYNEAKTEIERLVQVKTENGNRIPNEVSNWQSSEWYNGAVSKRSNIDIYKKHVNAAELILFSDIEEELVVVEFVNSNKKVLNFIESERTLGFFKYDRFLKDVDIGDTLKVRMTKSGDEGYYLLRTCEKVKGELYASKFVKKVIGTVNIPAGKTFAFIDDVFVAPDIVIKHNLSEGMEFEGKAIKTYDKRKGKWGWKLI